MGKRILGWFCGIIVFFLVVGVAMLPIEEDVAAEQPEQNLISAEAHVDAEPNETVEPDDLPVSTSALPESKPTQTVEQVPASDSAEPSETEAETEPAEEDVPADYILNISSGKFHDLSCPSVDLMNESNKRPFVGTREEAIEQGYNPCLNCNP